MDKSSRVNVPLADQAKAWDGWNQAAKRDESLHKLPAGRQWQRLQERVQALGRRDLKIADIGCGSGWTCERLLPYGQVTGTDFSVESIAEAAKRMPQATFIPGNLFEVDLPRGQFDLVVCLEVLAHVADQPALVRRLAELLAPGGHLFMATQNRPVLERWSAVGAPMPGTLRRWVDRPALFDLLSAQFDAIEIESVFPVGDQGLLRLVNSEKLNRVAEGLIPRATLTRWKEQAMLGHSLLAWARRPKAG